MYAKDDKTQVKMRRYRQQFEDAQRHNEHMVFVVKEEREHELLEKRWRSKVRKEYNLVDRNRNGILSLHSLTQYLQTHHVNDWLMRRFYSYLKREHERLDGMYERAYRAGRDVGPDPAEESFSRFARNFRRWKHILVLAKTWSERVHHTKTKLGLFKEKSSTSIVDLMAQGRQVIKDGECEGRRRGGGG